MIDQNTFVMTGKIAKIELSHEFRKEKFYRFFVEVARLSDNVDTLPVIVHEKLLYKADIEVGSYVRINGSIRTKNIKQPNGKRRSKMLVFGYAGDIEVIDEITYNQNKNENTVSFVGHVCKQPIFRRTQSGRRITDLNLACNRYFNKSDYIPSITWGVNAKMSRSLQIGDEVSISGRFQSREFTRREADGSLTKHIAYEISVSQIEVIPFEEDDDLLNAETGM